MDGLAHIQGLLIGLIGWAATVVLALNSTKLTRADQRAIMVFSWTLWMIPALGALVYHNVLAINEAAFYCIGTTLLLGIAVSVGSIRWRTKP